MADIANLPRQQSAMTENGMASREWYNYFRRLEDRIGAATGTGGGDTTINNGDTTIVNNLFIEPTIQDATTARRLTFGDAFRLIEFTSATAVTVTVPKVADEFFPDDCIIYLTQGAAGQVTITPDAGVTIDYSDSLKTRTQESTIGIKMIQPDKWQVFGDYEPVAPARSVLIRSANSAGVPAFVSPTADGQVLTRTSGAVVWGDVPGAWTYIKLGSDFTTTSATAVDITGLAFTPAASTTYEIEAQLLCQTATTTVGVRHGVAWPTGVTDGVAYLEMTSAAGTTVLQNGNFNAAVLSPVGGLPNTTQSWPAQAKATLVMGGSPSGTFKLQVASETGGTTVTVKTGSWLKYRSI